jgi:WD40 repeat protein
LAAFLGSSGAVTVSAGGTLKIWDLKIRDRGQSSPFREIYGNHTRILSVEASPDGRLIASTHFDQATRIWDAVTGELVAQFKHRQLVFQAWFAPGGQTLVTVDRLGSVRHYNLHTDLRPVADWFAIANLLGGHPAGQDDDIKPADEKHGDLSPAQAAWERLRTANPQDFSTSAEDELNWSRRSPPR